MLVSFQGQEKAVTRGSKVLGKKYYRPAGVWRFFVKPEGLGLEPPKGGGHTFALKKRGPAYGSPQKIKWKGMREKSIKAGRDNSLPLSENQLGILQGYGIANSLIGWLQAKKIRHGAGFYTFVKYLKRLEVIPHHGLCCV